METVHTSRSVEKTVDISGSYLRKLVRAGVVNPRKDTSGRYVYTDADVEQLLDFRADILRRRQQRELAR